MVPLKPSSRADTMTIVVAVTSPEGIVLASDSRTTLLRGGPLRHRIGTDHARKLFTPCDRVGMACYGAAEIQDQSISSLVERFTVESVSTNQGYGPKEICELLVDFFGARFREASEKSG